jgi:hypothetical protein
VEELCRELEEHGRDHVTPAVSDSGGRGSAHHNHLFAQSNTELRARATLVGATVAQLDGVADSERART